MSKELKNHCFQHINLTDPSITLNEYYINSMHADNYKRTPKSYLVQSWSRGTSITSTITGAELNERVIWAITLHNKSSTKNPSYCCCSLELLRNPDECFFRCVFGNQTFLHARWKNRSYTRSNVHSRLLSGMARDISTFPGSPFCISGPCVSSLYHYFPLLHEFAMKSS